MRMRIIVVVAFLCAAVLFAVLAATLYMQARHVPCRWTTDYCSPLDNLIFEGAVVRGCAVALIIVVLARGALIYWRWRLHETTLWSVILVEGAMLVLGIAVVWALSQAALDTYTQLYSSVPIGAAGRSREVLVFLNQLDRATGDFYWLGRALAITTGLAVVACAVRIWHTFDIEQRNTTRALQYKYLPHKHY